jgi:CheY-like chemotaxis protein
MRVLIADGDVLVRRALSVALVGAGFDVATAADGERALRLADATPPDIALVDLQMSMGGLEICHALKSRFRDAICVAILHNEDVEGARCFRAGADAVLQKPISPMELRRRLMSVATALHPLPS